MAKHVLHGIDLPSGMLWEDEFSWSAAARSVERSITGALVIDVAAQQAGRPITLRGVNDQGWMRRAQLLLLRALSDNPGGRYSLQLADGRVFTVQFAPDNPIDAEPIGRPELPTQDWPYVVTLRLITV